MGPVRKSSCGGAADAVALNAHTQNWRVVEGAKVTHTVANAVRLGSEYLWDREASDQAVAMLRRSKDDVESAGGYSGSVLCTVTPTDQQSEAVVFFRIMRLHSTPLYPKGGRGCVSVILNWGIQQADASGAKIFLESSPQAHRLYTKYGWRDIDQSMINLGHFGGKGLYPLTIMVRDPVAVQP
ncbi:hypothetical protein P175DRAFT_0555346 [Aspergillus ochraceoroseus IBT 24754]|uniref:N-acetyltransferase domain-containing protein n=1 Tax=Aspergillus ochraceoroseus IBT 24754 TaxID=1392256 RepID=A0A2T5M2B5_9EURO|nr:uncharacterized protein P175DRAFT_0555346 [Aspergillus ochraceoroseus IBT 24754]PTU22680.1 hypothetical protein P175DRAFT_0555346 [Aspergillus ochraceoroseus IBT 24754]